jgi:hypothetical protein
MQLLRPTCPFKLLGLLAEHRQKQCRDTQGKRLRFGAAAFGVMAVLCAFGLMTALLVRE